MMTANTHEEAVNTMYGAAVVNYNHVFSVDGRTLWMRGNTDLLKTIAMMAEKAARYDSTRENGGESSEYRQIANGIWKTLVKPERVELPEEPSVAEDASVSVSCDRVADSAAVTA